MTQTSGQLTRAWVLHPDIQTDARRKAPEPALSEAVALAAALPQLDVAGAEVVRLPRPQPGMLFGKGKVADLKAQFAAADIELVLIDGTLSPVQQRNLEKTWDVKILDRTGLILEIFADRARTKEGVLQVELAALSYQRTRLVRAWTHLERQRGGLGFVGGPGETQIESDRRAIDTAIVRIRKQLSKVVNTRTLHRASRAKVPFAVVALVGYTNAGKSTLFNRLTGARVVVKDMLFATLDPTMRAVDLPQGGRVIMSDTVGFISDLPTQLVAAFRATLEEVLSADLILHVRDISHADSAAQAHDVAAILAELGVDPDTPQLEVWNKIDALNADDRASAETEAGRDAATLSISALTGEGIDALLAAISSALQSDRHTSVLTLTAKQGRQRAWLYDANVVQGEDTTDKGQRLTVLWTRRQQAQFDGLKR